MVAALLVEFLIPSRTARPGDDPIFALNAEAKRQKAEGKAVINATVGALLDDEGRLATLPTVAEALREVPSAVAMGYAPIAGSPEFLRAVVADTLGETERQAVAVATPGGTGALRHAIANFLDRGHALLTSSFYWGPYKTLADEADRALDTHRTFDDRGAFDVADLDRKLGEHLAKQGRALVFLNTPCHNPTGYSLDDAECAALGEVLARRSAEGAITVLLDAAYAHYGDRGTGGVLRALRAVADRVMVLVAWSASKSYTLYGGRVGALLALVPNEAERKRVDAALTYSCRGTWSNCNALGMAAVTRVLTEPALAARVTAERGALVELLGKRVAAWNQLAKPAGIAYPRYDGGFFTTVLCDKAPERAKALRERGVFVVPQEGALRVALCSVAERDVPRLVSEVAAALSVS